MNGEEAVLICVDEASKISDEDYKELENRMKKPECARCGECCKVIPLTTQFMPAEYRKYLLQRGLKEDQGFILIPHVCQHLFHGDPETPVLYERESGKPVEGYTCLIHDTPDRSLACRKFTGQKRIGPWRMYVPPNCAFNKKEGKP